MGNSLSHWQGDVESEMIVVLRAAASGLRLLVVAIQSESMSGWTLAELAMADRPLAR
jgi:hypothetical protein